MGRLWTRQRMEIGAGYSWSKILIRWLIGWLIQCVVIDYHSLVTIIVGVGVGMV